MMRRHRKNAVIVALCCIALGAVLTVAAVFGGGLDFQNLNGVFAETQIKTVVEPFTSIRIFGLNNDIRFLPADGEPCSVQYSNRGSITSIAVENDTLTILQTATERWHDSDAKNDQPIIIYLPQTSYKKLSVTTADGSITVPQFFRFDEADIWSTSGDIVFYAGTESELRLRNTDGSIRADHQVSMGDDICNAVTVLTASGNIDLSNIHTSRIDVCSSVGAVNLSQVLTESAAIETTEGDIIMADCDGRDWSVNSINGNIRGSLLSPKQFFVSSGVGDMEYPDSQADGDRFVAVTHGGVIRITLVK